MKRLNRRTLGTILMALGFVFTLIVLAKFPENKQLALYGFAAIGIGCVIGINRPQQKK
jgi:hypothetical protein